MLSWQRKAQLLTVSFVGVFGWLVIALVIVALTETHATGDPLWWLVVAVLAWLVSLQLDLSAWLWRRYLDPRERAR